MRRWHTTFLFLLSLGAGLAWHFHGFVDSGFDALPGDPGDYRFNQFLAEHWHLVLTGEVPWRSPLGFYPVEGTLGFSDALFLFGLAHTALRVAGLDLWWSFVGTLMLLAVLGHVGFWNLARRAFGLHAPLCALGAFLFLAISPVLHATLTYHPQLYAVWLVPWVLLPLLRCLQSPATAVLRATGWGSLFILGWGLLLFTGFYIGWFLGLYLALTAVVYAGLLLVRQGRDGGRTIIRYVTARWRQMLLLAPVALLAVMPVLLTYLPVYGAVGGSPYEDIRQLQPWPWDLINAGPGNLVHGWWTTRLPALTSTPFPWELWYGFPLATLALFLVGLWRHRREIPAPTPAHGSGDLLLAGGLAVLVFWVLVIRLGPVSLWWLGFQLIPGAEAVRAIYRVNLLLALPVLLVILRFLHHPGAPSPPGRWRFAVLLLAPLLLVVESVNTVPRSRLSRASEAARVNPLPTPPAAAQAFAFAPGGAFADHPDPYHQQLDAMLLAQHWRLPTLHGYSGKLPPDYLILSADDPAYADEINRWRRRHELFTGIYPYDARNHTWGDPGGVDDIVPAAALPLLLRFTPDGNSRRYLVAGWSQPEPTFTWTDGTAARLLLRLPATGNAPLELMITADAFVNRHHPVQVATLQADDFTLGTWTFRDGEPPPVIRTRLPAEAVADGLLSLTLRLPAATSPAALGISGDTRQLGLAVRQLELRPLDPSPSPAP